MNRKLRKLLTNPSLFVRDAAQNRVTDLTRRLPRMHRRVTSRRFSVIAAVYGVEKYLDDFFRSMVRQSIDFNTQIQLIMVDDGSPDRSAEIIARWQEKYPRSIRYVRKENGGQASARNVGLDHATGDWVTFIDPDDFVDDAYFQRVNEFLDRGEAERVALVSGSIVFYHEKTQRYRDGHPLRYRFASGDRVVKTSELLNDIHLSASCSFFRRDLLRDSGLRFDETIRPNFEDAHLVNRYLMALPDHDVGFAPRAKYYYRKREDESSTLDQAWTRPERFGVVLERGYLDLLRASERASENGRAAPWIQRTVLYELVWYFKRLVNGAETTAFLSDEERQRFSELLREIVSKIDVSTILEFELAGAWLYHKIGILGLFKGLSPEFQHVYVEDFDPTKSLVQLRYFFRGQSPLEQFSLNGVEVFPAFAKVRRHDLLGEEFVLERIVWLPAGPLTGRLEVTIGTAETRIMFRGKIHRDGLPVRDVARLKRPLDPSRLPLDLRYLHRLATSPLAVRMYGDAFLFMDRDTQADDNAEHLYRYVHESRPDINAFFVLRRSSHDWDRLASEGFRLLAFGSLQHRIALINCKHLISSHADAYVTNFPQEKGWEELRQRRYTFLQHGVIQGDLSGWLNAKDIDCFVTASAAENASIVASGTPYKFTDREVVLTGLPRHDALRSGASSPDRVIVIMPTWRRSLVGAVKGAGNDRIVNPRFYESDYAQAWRSLLHSPALKSLVEEHGYRVHFFPHANIQPYMDWFAPPPHVQATSHDGGSIQDIFRSASVLITDYSSTAFDVAYLGRAILYYQFDRELVLSGGHFMKESYFDYERDGFGPVCLDEAVVIQRLSEILAADAVPSQTYRERVQSTFAHHDARNCERTLDAILALDAPTHPLDRSLELLVEAARSATAHRAWRHAENRWSRVLEIPPERRPEDSELRLAEAKRELGRVDEADAILSAKQESGDDGAELEIARAEVASTAGFWPRAIALWTARVRASGDESQRDHALLRLAEAYRRSGAHSRARAALEEIERDTPAVRTEMAELASAHQRWDEACERWQALADEAASPEMARVRLAEALTQLGRYAEAMAEIDRHLAGGSPKHEREARALRLVLATALREADGSADDPASSTERPTNVVYLGRLAKGDSSS